MFTGPLPKNGRPSIARVRLAGMYLQSRCLPMGIHFTIFNFTWLGYLVRAAVDGRSKRNMNFAYDNVSAEEHFRSGYTYFPNTCFGILPM